MHGSAAIALLGLFSALPAVHAVPGPQHEARGPYLTVCQNIAQAVSSASAVYYPITGSLLGNYVQDVSHWASSSTQTAACSVEPGTAQDVSTIIQILGSSRTPFAVKGGGHTTNPGFSSTEGVHIAMSRFSQVTYHASSNTADVGTGIIWDDVYAALEPFGVNVVGGRVPGVGVAGFTLGGGYSWLTNQYGLTIDNIVAYELVLPDGTITTVTSTSNPDLFFGLRGGFNNFGIVTKFTLKTYPQGQVWGGIRIYAADKFQAVNDATVKFSAQVTDTKAAILPTYDALAGIPTVIVIMFYDGPTPPAGIFDDLLAIPALAADIKTRSFSSLVQSSPAQATAGTRAVFHTLSVTGYSDEFMAAVVNETLFWGAHLNLLTSNVFVSYDIEPFLPSIFSHGAASAYPPDRSRALLPTNIYFAWELGVADNLIISSALQSAQQLQHVAESEGQNIANAALYGNYAESSTPLTRIYGSNLPRLQSIKAQYDPHNVMNLAGGWRF